jgi:hypothetical protein
LRELPSGFCSKRAFLGSKRAFFGRADQFWAVRSRSWAGPISPGELRVLLTNKRSAQLQSRSQRAIPACSGQEKEVPSDSMSSPMVNLETAQNDRPTRTAIGGASENAPDRPVTVTSQFRSTPTRSCLRSDESTGDDTGFSTSGSLTRAPLRLTKSGVSAELYPGVGGVETGGSSDLRNQ